MNFISVIIIHEQHTLVNLGKFETYCTFAVLSKYQSTLAYLRGCTMLFQVDSCIIQLRKFLALSQFFELKCKYCHKRLVHHCYPSKGPIASPHSHYFNLRFTTNSSHYNNLRTTFWRVLQCMLQSNCLERLLILRFSINFEYGIKVFTSRAKSNTKIYQRTAKYDFLYYKT